MFDRTASLICVIERPLPLIRERNAVYGIRYLRLRLAKFRGTCVYVCTYVRASRAFSFSIRPKIRGEKPARYRRRRVNF